MPVNNGHATLPPPSPPGSRPSPAGVCTCSRKRARATSDVPGGSWATPHMGTRLEGRGHLGLGELLEHDDALPCSPLPAPRTRLQLLLVRDRSSHTLWRANGRRRSRSCSSACSCCSHSSRSVVLASCASRARARAPWPSAPSLPCRTDEVAPRRRGCRPSCPTLWASTAPDTRAVRATCGRTRCACVWHAVWRRIRPCPQENSVPRARIRAGLPAARAGHMRGRLRRTRRRTQGFRACICLAVRAHAH